MPPQARFLLNVRSDIGRESRLPKSRCCVRNPNLDAWVLLHYRVRMLKGPPAGSATERGNCNSFCAKLGFTTTGSAQVGPVVCEYSNPVRRRSLPAASGPPPPAPPPPPPPPPPPTAPAQPARDSYRPWLQIAASHAGKPTLRLNSPHLFRRTIASSQHARPTSASSPALQPAR
jgi:hypothetical protein